jgi:hypothetical protein
MGLFSSENVRIDCSFKELDRVIAYLRRKQGLSALHEQWFPNVEVYSPSKLDEPRFVITVRKSDLTQLPLEQAIDRLKRGVLD